MDISLVKTSSNWSHIGGCEFVKAIQLKTADPDIFSKPLLDDIVNEEKSLLLGKGEVEEYCELYIELYPHYKIQAISLVCNVAKIEIFQGPQIEYLETIYGIIVDEADEHFKTFRYDIEVEKSGITNLTLKFLTHSADVCIFGIMLHTAPNPNGITTLNPSTSCINIENVQSILQNASKTISPASENCIQLLELMTKTKMLNSNETQPSLDQLVKQWHVDQPQKINVDESASRGGAQQIDDIEHSLKNYIDKRFQEMEDRFRQQLKVMEERQIEKLDNILRILEKMDK